MAEKRGVGGLITIAVSLLVPLCAWAKDIPKVEDDWATEEILESGNRSGWLVSAPTRAMAEHLAGKAAPHVVTGKLLRKAFPLVMPRRTCEYSWDIRIFPKDMAEYASLKSVADSFMKGKARSADEPKQVIRLRKQAGRPANQVTRSEPGDERHPYVTHSYLAVDIGTRMLIFSCITQTRAGGDLAACAEAYAEGFLRVSSSIKPVAAQPDEGPGAAPLLR
ncbi:MAG: hypothetical protein NTY77_10270 [Elusimicrobia bacterium]|nr:hypothetical protein [Elusimicrobiota bacterium]